MSDLQSYRPVGGGERTYAGSPWTRQGRALAQITGSAEVAVMHTAAAVHVEAARMDALDMMAQRGLQGVAMVSQVEQQLATMVPFAASRLQAIGDLHAFTIANEMLRFGRVI